MGQVAFDINYREFKGMKWLVQDWDLGSVLPKTEQITVHAQNVEHHGREPLNWAK